MLKFAEFERVDTPFTYWIGRNFISPAEVREINASWPSSDDQRWIHEIRSYTQKSAIMFPRRLHDPAQKLAAALYAPDKVKELSALIGRSLLPDPWFTEGELVPRVGGGLHEIHPGGLLKMHVDFDIHPTGLTRAINFLLYLSEGWQEGWGGALKLGDGDGTVATYPNGGTAVIFETNGSSWHGHPEPLTCPVGKTRRSLALYYYRESTEPPQRKTTLYRVKIK